MIYLDNAATSFPKPPSVINEMTNCLNNYCANAGRGGHALSIASSNAVMKTRELVSDFFGVTDPSRVCFTKNATEAINVAIKGFLQDNTEVITTSMEHNSVIRPLKELEKMGKINLCIIECDNDGIFEPKKLKDLINSKTSLFISTLSSNVSGVIFPINELGIICKENNITFMVDASQGAGHLEIDVVKQNIDLLAFPGHKGLLGPQGTGGLFVREGIILKSLIEGGTGSSSENLFQPFDMPEVLESGTLNTPGIVGLGAGIEFLKNEGIQNIRLHKHKLISIMHDAISQIKGVKIYSMPNLEQNSGIFAFNFTEINSTEVSYCLDKIYNIAVRSGLHCAPIAHKTLGTIDSGIVRVSPSYFNTEDDVQKFLVAIEEISQNA